MTLPSSAVRLTGHDLVLREWEEADLPVMAELFDDPGVAYRTPLASPFGLDEARAYLEMVRRTRAAGDRLHLAITTDGHKPLGEVLVSLSGPAWATPSAPPTAGSAWRRAPPGC